MLEEKLAELRTVVCFEFFVNLFSERREINEDVKSSIWLMGEDAVLDQLLRNVGANSFGNPSLV